MTPSDAPRLVTAEIQHRGVQSLCWEGDTLVDVVGGFRRLHLDGREEASRISWGYRFDRARLLPTAGGTWVVLYENRGTKAVLLRDGHQIRELNRSYHCAEDYDYAIALGLLPTERVAVFHCPDAYNQLEIEDAETGERLTRRTSESPDFFHSRLEVSPGGQYLVSAGWIWHPLEDAQVFEIAEALRDPETLNVEEGFSNSWYCEVEAATFSGPQRLVIAFKRDNRAEAEEVPLEPV
jgi:hypothetical protein